MEFETVSSYTFGLETVIQRIWPALKHQSMLLKIRIMSSYTFIMRLIFLPAVMLALMAGCATGPHPEPPEFEYTVSLLQYPPFIKNEITWHDPDAQPIRLVVNNESVAGWLSPEEKVLRFPVQLNEGAHLTFRLGAVSEGSLQSGDLKVRVEFETVLDSETIRETVYEDEMVPGSNWSNNWKDADIDLSEWGLCEGDLYFILDGPMSDRDDVRVLWGQPAVYCDNERINRNVILIGVDTLRADALDVYGGRGEVSPNLRNFSESATTFYRTWGQAPFTVPSFASMLTGLYPADIIPTLATGQLPPNTRSIAGLLLEHGISTGMICGNAYMGNENSGFQPGMESLWYSHNANPAETLEAAKVFIERERNRDWFLFLHFMDPHGPYDPPPEYINSLCDPSYIGNYMTSFMDGMEWQLLPPNIPSQYEIDRAKSLYEAEVAELDNAIGGLTEFLEQNGMQENTLIVFSSDHGEEFFEHGQFEHGQSLYEEMVRLPLIVRGFEFPENERINTPVGNIDIAPTILEFFGLDVPDKYHGIPLQDIVSGEVPNDRIIFSEGKLRRGNHTKCAIEWPYKCTLDFFTGETRLYHLTEDPDEFFDLSGRYPELVERLSGEMILRMPPMLTTFALFILGDPEGGPGRLSGTINVPGGIAYSTDYGLTEEDQYSVDGDTINWDFNTNRGIEIKALVVIPVQGHNIIEATLRADGEIDPARFFPYSSGTLEPSGSATIDVFEVPWPAQIPPDAMDRPVACYILGIPGFPRDGSPDFEQTELDPETIEKLRALGYVN